MNKIFTKTFLLSMIISALTLLQAEAATIHISTIADLQAINNSLTDDYILDNDLDLSSIPNFTPIGSSASPFYGTFNGGGYTISNLKISAGENAGLFRYAASSSKIENFIISNSIISGGNYTGAAVGYSEGIVDSIGVMNTIISGDQWVGGVIGKTFGTSTNLYIVGGNVSGRGAGGIIGWLSGYLSNTFSRTIIYNQAGYSHGITNNGDNASGGIAGIMDGSGTIIIPSINNSYSLSSLYGINQNQGSFIGGIVGKLWNANIITNSYSDSNMFGYFGVGGVGAITSRVSGAQGGIAPTTTNVFYNNVFPGYKVVGGGISTDNNPPNSAVPQSVLYSSTTLPLGNQFQLTTSGNNKYPAVLNSSTGQILGGSNQFVQVSAPFITLPAQTTYNYTTGPTAPKFNVSVIALPVPTYRWERSTSTNGVYSHLSNNLEYAPDITTSGTYYYRLITTNTIGTATSSPIEVITIPGSAATPTIISQPSNQTLALGATTTFSVTASSATGTLSYQWQYSVDNTNWNDYVNIATSSSVYEPLPLEHKSSNAFDGNGATLWAPSDGTTTGWAQVQYYKPVKISKYSIVARPDSLWNSQSPKKWNVQASNDGSSWVTIDSRINQTWTSAGQRQDYATSSISAYKYYRFNFEEILSGSQLSLADIILYENNVEVPFSINSNSNTLEYTQSSASTLWFRLSISNTELYKSATTIISTPFSLTAAAQGVASISGSISYYASSTKPIVGAQISLTNTDNNTLVSTTTTNNTGAYTFNNVLTGGNYKLSATYTTSSSTTGININDNVRNAQIIVGTYTPTDDAKISADTNQDGIININDNVRNAQIIVGTYQLPIPFIFIPTDKTNLNATSTENSITKKNYLWPSYQSKTITNLNSDTTINFKGYKVGDANGDWK